jgi:hypothetical protein
MSFMKKKKTNILIDDISNHVSLYDLYSEKAFKLKDTIEQTSKWCFINGLPVKTISINLESVNGKKASYRNNYYFGFFKK